MENTNQQQVGIFSKVKLDKFSDDEKEILNSIARKYWKVTRAEIISLSNSIYKIVLIKPTEFISHCFNLKREVVVVFSDYDTFQPRTIEAIDYKGVQSLRVEEVCCFVISKDTSIEKQILQLIKSNQESRVIVPFSYSELLEEIDNDEYIINKTRQHFYSRDLFSIQDPLKKDLYFFGRNDLIQGLVNKHLNNENSGLFGLRKTGKTSILYGVERTLDKKKNICVLIDCQTLHMKSWNDALFYIIRQLFDKSQNVSEKNIHTIQDYSSECYASDYFEKDIVTISKKNKKKILVVFDEIEHISYGTSISDNWREGDYFIKFWQSIRSAYQKNSEGVFSYLITGTNPRCVEMSTIKKVDNPIFMQFQPTYIPAFTYSQTSEMVNRLGGYMGITFDESVCVALNDDFGGHPLLIRQMCSYIHRSAEFERPHCLSKFEYEEYKRKYFDSDSTFYKYAEMVLNVLQDWYPDEYQMLEWLSIDDQETFNGLAELSPTYIDHLKKYNIIVSISNRYYFNNASLKLYLERHNKYQKLHTTIEEKQHEISERRNKLEPQLRKVVKQILKILYGEEIAKQKVISEIYGTDKVGRYMNKQYSDLFDPTKTKIYLSSLFSLIKKNWNDGFNNIFECSIEIFEARSIIINSNRKVDAHAAEITEEQFQEFRGAIGWMEKKVEECLAS